MLIISFATEPQSTNQIVLYIYHNLPLEARVIPFIYTPKHP